MMPKPTKRSAVLLILASLMAGTAAWADTTTTITLHDGKFDPAELTLPAKVRSRIVVRNQDSLPAEFESYSLSREVLVPPHGEVSFFVGPAEPGRYEYFNDFNHDMNGVVILDTRAEGH